jgi:hypothetical protein
MLHHEVPYLIWIAPVEIENSVMPLSWRSGATCIFGARQADIRLSLQVSIISQVTSDDSLVNNVSGVICDGLYKVEMVVRSCHSEQDDRLRLNGDCCGHDLYPEKLWKDFIISATIKVEEGSYFRSHTPTRISLAIPDNQHMK